MIERSFDINGRKSEGEPARGRFRGLTFAELLAVLMISAMVISATAVLYVNVERSLGSVDKEIATNALPQEVLQLMAEDIDRIGSGDFDVKLKLLKKTDSGYDTYRLEMISLIYGNNNKPVEFEKVVWQSVYDPESDRLIIYRGRHGIAPEDPVLDTQARENPDSMIFVPVAQGVSFFQLEVYNGQEFGDSWASKTLPRGVRGRLSFAEPVQNADGTMYLPPESIYNRMMSLEHDKNVQFKFVAKDLDAIYGTKEDESASENEADKNTGENTDENASTAAGENAPAGGAEKPADVKGAGQ